MLQPFIVKTCQVLRTLTGLISDSTIQQFNGCTPLGGISPLPPDSCQDPVEMTMQPVGKRGVSGNQLESSFI
jgi:hypothetical protein